MMRPGMRLRLPNGVLVQCCAPTCDAPVMWELRGPVGWGRWGVDRDDGIVALEPNRQGGWSVRQTGWGVDDLADLR
jgi:hypothetical protein